MNYKRLILAGIVFGECILIVLLGVRLYRVWFVRRNVLGAQYVTKIPKDTMVFPTDSYLKHFYEPKPNSTEVDTSSWLSSPVTYRYNSVGMRSDREYSIQKPANVFRVMTLGDSFTWGQGVPLEDTFSSRLGAMLNANVCNSPKTVEVMNLGVTSYDIQYTVEHFRRLGQQYHPDLVIWLVNEHNMKQLADLLTPLAQQIYSETSESAKQKYFDDKNYYFASRQALEQIEKQLGDKYIFSVQRAALDKFSTYYQGSLVLFMFEWDEQKIKDAVESYSQQRKNTYISTDLPYLDPAKGVTLADGHPSPKGHESIATYMFQYLQNEKIISCLNN